jgi:hypothetical protein
MLSKSPQRGTFFSSCRLAELEKEGIDINSDCEKAEVARETMAIDQQHRDFKDQLEASEEWKENNLEYDLRSTDWILEKARASESYSQNLYAAMCNNMFKNKNGKKWFCSWRYAGGIVADMRQEGDYIDWYCSGIRDVSYDEEENESWDGRSFVSESTVTDEIKEDLRKLGWEVIEYEYD